MPDHNLSHDIRAAAARSAPVALGYFVMSIAFGLSLNQIGIGTGWALIMSIFVYAGSLQFAMVGFLASAAALPAAALMALLINARHMFYGLSFISRFKRMGKAYPYMIFSLTDETYSVLLAGDWPEGVNPQRADFLTSLFNHLSWILGTLAGSLAGLAIPFSLAGIDFSMTALFLVIFLEQWLQARNHFPAVTGLTCVVISLLLLGPDRFLLPAIIITVLILVSFQARTPVPARERKEET